MFLRQLKISNRKELKTHPEVWYGIEKFAVQTYAQVDHPFLEQGLISHWFLSKLTHFSLDNLRCCATIHISIRPSTVHHRTLSETHYHIDLSDCFIKMGQAWPRLECFHLRRSKRQLQFVSLCRESRLLSTAVRSSKRSHSPSMSHRPHFHQMCPRRADGTISRGSNVWFANFCDSPISTPVSVAKYLSNLPPHLTYLGIPSRPEARTRV
ncbi:hypothetical protein EDC04DRAFT_747264 [Pisolithus marmoratus]|nr:hypothetical protein EDC04DRAFT_747264 [Pisolithus marmoratus]